ncbi:glycosyltransferase family 2 protein [Winogradskyella forsetii]|uniref:glycosyltransferase family 2 protein n=1 Tax=Winogradskyella forsetii TaxID=2686077 RepID=UPI0015BD8AC3|nr:glycosyltransferase [Winogradskyella forsetii]
MSKWPLTSICIPTYNGEQFIEAAMDSVMNQTYENIEIIISDDASSDNTLSLINNYVSESNFPIHIYHHTPSGIGANWNHSIKNAKGEYIKFLFQDDLLEPTCIEEMVEVLQGDPKIGLVCSKRHIIIESDSTKENMEHWLDVYGDLQNHLHLNYNPIGIIDKRFFKSKYFFKIPVNVVGEPPAVMFHRDMLKTVGYFREDMTQFLDFEYWYRILKHKNIAVIDKKIISFRVHANQATQNNKGKMKSDKAIYKKLLYTDYFWLLNRSRQKQLFLEFHPIGQFMSKYLNFQ